MSVCDIHTFPSDSPTLDSTLFLLIVNLDFLSIAENIRIDRVRNEMPFPTSHPEN